jgi:trk system potassium uptake protein TrkA
VVQQDRAELGIQVVEFAVGKEAHGKPAGSLNYGVSSKLLMILRDNKRLQFDEGTALEAGDRVVMLLRREGWNTVTECLGPDVDSAACRMYTIPEELAAEAAVKGQADGSTVIVGGCSMVGAHLAYVLSMEGHRVTVIDEDPALFKRLPPGYAGEFVEGVIYDEETLIEAGIESADAFVSVTKKDNKNLMAAEVARHVFEVPHVMARLFNPDKEPTYQALKMPFVSGTTMLAQVMLERLLNPVVSVRARCLFNRYNLVEFECPASWNGKTVRSVVNDAGVTFAYIVRRSSAYVPEDNFVLRSGDLINALVTTKRLTRLERSLGKR